MPELVSAGCAVALIIRDWQFHDRRTRNHHLITRGLVAALACASAFSFSFKVYDEFSSRAAAKEVREWQRGSSVPPRLEFRVIDNTGGLYAVVAYNPSETPIHNLQITVQSLNDMVASATNRFATEEKPKTLQEYLALSDGINFNVGMLNPHEFRNVGTFHVLSGFRYPAEGGDALQIVQANVSTTTTWAIVTCRFYRRNEKITSKSEAMYGLRDGKQAFRERWSASDYPDKNSWDKSPTPF